MDRKLIYELDKNSRAPYSVLAKATRTKQETVRYRVAQLVKTGAIQKFLTIINTKKLGFSYYKLFIKLQNINETKKNKILAFLKENTKIAWVAELDGNFDISCIIAIQNQQELELLINDLYGYFGNMIMKKEVVINLQAEFFPRDYLINAERKIQSAPIYKAIQEFRMLDTTDKAICSFLAENARMSAVDIGKQLHLSPDTIIQRVKRLQKEEIISGFTLVLNNEILHQLHYKIALYLTSVDQRQIMTMLSFIRNNKRVISIVKVLGEWDYEIDIEVEHPQQLKEIIMNITNQFSEMIRDYTLFRIIKMHKFTFFPQ